MGSSLFLLLREGLEAALIIGIILGYLGKIDQRKFNNNVYIGILLAVAASILTAFLFQTVIGGFEGKAEQLFEGLIMFFAVIVLTYMIFWMHRQSRGIGKDLKEKVDTLLSNNQKYGLILLTFLSVFREGVEVVLFFQVTSSASGKSEALIGGILGLFLAVVLAYLIFKTSIKLDLKAFFKVTGIILIVISAGLLAHSIHELQEAAIIPTIIEHLWDTNRLINEKGSVGSILTSIFGYNGNPSLIEVIVYWMYLIITGKKFLGSYKRA